MDLSSFIGLFGAIGLILLGNKIEGGHVDSLIQPTAAIIVFGGTFGAGLLQYPLGKALGALSAIKVVFFPTREKPEQLIVRIVDFARRARREGILALEKEINDMKDPFFAKALTMAVDGLEPKALYESMETELETIEKEGEDKAKFWEALGGYAPTVGILGAVLGLIHVMGNISDPEKLGAGIAVAFVATVYGVGSANLMFLPMAGKLKDNIKTYCHSREIILRGVLLIQEGINHSVIEEQLKGFLSEKQKKTYSNGSDGGAAVES